MENIEEHSREESEIPPISQVLDKNCERCGKGPVEYVCTVKGYHKYRCRNCDAVEVK